MYGQVFRYPLHHPLYHSIFHPLGYLLYHLIALRPHPKSLLNDLIVLQRHDVNLLPCLSTFFPASQPSLPTLVEAL